MKIYNNRVNNEYFTCLPVILLDSVFVTSDKELYAPRLLEECKHAIKKLINAINEDLELSESGNE